MPSRMTLRVYTRTADGKTVQRDESVVIDAPDAGERDLLSPSDALRYPPCLCDHPNCAATRAAAERAAAAVQASSR